MNIVVKSNGFVTGDFLSPVAYAGEKNSRSINIAHPTFEDAIYQLIVIKEKRPYTLGIRDGVVLLPPSMTDIECTLECRFAAMRKGSNEDVLENCNCGTTSYNDCSDLVFLSDKFNLTVGEGLSLNGLTPVPPYEEVLEMYNNISKAKMVLEQSKLDSQNMANVIDDKIKQLQSTQYLNDLTRERRNRIDKDEELETKLDSIINNYQDPVQQLINQLHNNATRNENIITLTSDTILTEDFILSNHIELIIPRSITLTIHNSTFKVEGLLNVSGSIILENNANLLLSNKIELFNENVIDIQDDTSFIKCTNTCSIYIYNSLDKEYVETFGPSYIKMENGSLLTIGNGIYTLSGINEILSTNEIDTKNVVLSGFIYLHSQLKIINSIITIDKDSEFIIYGDLVLEDLNIQLQGVDKTSKLNITEYGDVTDLESNNIYLYQNEQWEKQ